MSRKLGKALLSYGIPTALLIWIFHDLNVREAVNSLKGLQWELVAAAVVVDVLGYVFQALRWRSLLRPLGRLPVMRLVQAIYTGLFVNEILPMRTGEVVRAYLVARWNSVRFRSVLPSMAVERLLDGVILTLAIGLTATFLPLPAGLTDAAEVLGAVILCLTLVFVYLVLRTARREAREAMVSQSARGFDTTPNTAAPTAPPTLPVRGLFRTIRRMLADVGEGVGRLGSGKVLSEASFYSVLLLASQALSFWLIIRAAGYGLSIWAGAAVLLIVHLGTAIPNAPANIGSYQFFCIVGLGLFGIEKSQATALAFVIFFILTVPLWLLGWIALHGTQLSLEQIRVNTQRWRGAESENSTDIGDAGNAGAPGETKMRKTMVQVSMLLLVATMALSGAAFGAAKKPKTIESEVRHELVTLPYYGVFDWLQYKVEGSKVTLLGFARQPTLKKDAEAVVKEIEGVEKVDNQIQVLPLSPADDRIRVAAYRAIYGNQSFWNYATLANAPIHIIVNNGKVSLEGVVNSQVDKSLAYAQVSGIPGTFSVTNNLRVVKG